MNPMPTCRSDVVDSVVNPLVKLPFGDGLCNPFVMILGMVSCWVCHTNSAGLNGAFWGNPLNRKPFVGPEMQVSPRPARLQQSVNLNPRVSSLQNVDLRDLGWIVIYKNKGMVSDFSGTYFQTASRIETKGWRCVEGSFNFKDSFGFNTHTRRYVHIYIYTLYTQYIYIYMYILI